MKNFIISLSKVDTSINTAINLKNQLESYGLQAELFEGTYGHDAVQMMKSEGRTLHPWGIKGPASRIDPNDEKLGRPGVKGCFYSHYRLWQKCVELDEPIVIWEDDIVLSRGYQPVEFDEILIVALGHQTKSAGYWHLLENPEGEPAALKWPRSSMPGCCGYAIKPQAAKKLLEVYEKTYLPADNAISLYHVQIQIHNYIMGRALIKSDGKRSLTTHVDFWEHMANPGQEKKSKKKKLAGWLKFSK